jgi:hypothetical protein
MDGLWLSVSGIEDYHLFTDNSVFNLGVPKRQQLSVSIDWIQCLFFFLHILMWKICVYENSEAHIIAEGPRTNSGNSNTEADHMRHVGAIRVFDTDIWQKWLAVCFDHIAFLEL